MPDYLHWIEKGDPSSGRVLALASILIRQARLQRAMTYGQVGDEMGIHWRAVDDVAYYLGLTLEALGETKGWRKRRPPQLQALIVNKGTKLPGKGINGFMSDAWNSAKSDEQRRVLLKSVYAELANYDHWEDVCTILGVEDFPGDFSSIVSGAKAAKGRGGEGEEHKALKAYVASHPNVVGLTAGGPEGLEEFRLASGDSVDVVFRLNRRLFAVEVKSKISSEGDMARGVFQCLKYKCVLDAESAVSKYPFSVEIALVLGRKMPASVRKLANALGVSVFEVENFS